MFNRSSIIMSVKLQFCNYQIFIDVFEFIEFNEYIESIDFEWEAFLKEFTFRSSGVLHILHKGTLQFWI